MKKSKIAVCLLKRGLILWIILSFNFPPLTVISDAQNITQKEPAEQVKLADVSMKEDKEYNEEKIDKEKEVKEEFQAVWISYLEFGNWLRDPSTGKLGFTEKRFQQMTDEMFDQAVKFKMNAVVVHVRPFGDAIYPSNNFPWSEYISGKQGEAPGFDPLKYMVSAAHERGLDFHAWINPYRVTMNSTNIKLLSPNNIARIWRTNSTKMDDRNILSFDGQLYFNPAITEVQDYICNGIEEIVSDYDVDGIHFDDYFYPCLGTNYKTNFDYIEYKSYYENCKNNGITAKSIADWRRENVNSLIQKTYQKIKSINNSVAFGISPGGFLDYLQEDNQYYCDVKTWLSNPGYIDYICPQLYWSFRHDKYPYDEILNRWLALRTNRDVKMYVGIAAYKAGSKLEKEWKNDVNILKDQVEYGRDTGGVDGFMYFRYDFFFNKLSKNSINKLLKIL